jgi:predicted metal-dependent peptidase
MLWRIVHQVRCWILTAAVFTGHVNVAPRHLTAEAESLLSATLIHEVMHVLGFDPHAFAHFRDEQKRRRSEVVQQVHDLKLGRMVTRVVLPRVIMHSRQHYGVPTQTLLKSTSAHFCICLPKCYCGADPIHWQ